MADDSAAAAGYTPAFPGEERLPLDALAAASLDAIVQAILAVSVRPELIVDGDGSPPILLQFANTVREIVGDIIRRAREGTDPAADAALVRGRNALAKCVAAVALSREAGGLETKGEAFTLRNALNAMTQTFAYEAAEDWCARSWPVKEGPHGWSLHWLSQGEDAAALDLLELVHRLLLKWVHKMEPIVGIERRASEWWFRRFTPTKENHDRARRRRIREREWSLTGRDMMYCGHTILEWAWGDGFLQILRPRALRMAKAALYTRPAVFVVREQSGLEAKFEIVNTHHQLTVLETEHASAPEPGTVFVGRVYPISGDRYVRSPGALRLGRWSDDEARHFDALVYMMSAMNNDPSVALEWVMSVALFDPDVDFPIPSPAAGSQQQARAKLNSLRHAMEEGFMLHEPDAKGALWLGQSPVSASQFTIFGCPADNAMAAWVDDLLGIAGIAHDAGTSVPW